MIQKISKLFSVVMLFSVVVNSADAWTKKVRTSDYDGAGGGVVSPRAADGGGVGRSSGGGGGNTTADTGGSSINQEVYDTPTGGGNCTSSCAGNGAIEINVAAQCMCVSGSKCFKIDTGRARLGGAMMTANGTGIMGNANSPGVGKYWTHPETSTRYDNDAISFGYFAQAGVGKWIHKSRGCGPGGAQNTIGCIGVPCQYWPLVKAQRGKRVVVCAANSKMTSLYGEQGAPRVDGTMGGRKKRGGR